MANKVKSARGTVVDFDLLKIKQQIADAPSVDVAARESFVERRLRRRTKRTAAPTIKQAEAVETTDEAEEAVVDDFEQDIEVEEEVTPVKPVRKPKQ